MFLYFLNTECVDAEALYILGDLFEYWVGDDQLDHDPVARQVADGLRKVSGAGVKIFFMHGNRDFLIGERFADEAGLTILSDPTEVLLGGKTRLLL